MTSVLQWARFAAVATASAGLTAGLLNLPTAFAVPAAGDSPTVVTSAETLVAAYPHHSDLGEQKTDHTVDAPQTLTDTPSEMGVPTSILWPTDRFIPQYDARIA